MDVLSVYSRRSLIWIVILLGMLCTLVNTMLYMLAEILSHTAQIQGKIGTIMGFEPTFMLVCVISVLFGIMGMGLWLNFRGSLKNVVEEAGKLPKKGAIALRERVSPPSAKELKEEALRKDKRMFLHLLSVLQNEGRLLDFFEENLDEYEDDQIGAAVRSIHENCRKVMNKYVKYKSIVEADEEAEIRIEQGFDPAAIKLMGNIVGDPPFAGVVRHKGWKAVKVELPTLSVEQDADIIAPAEIEIQ